MPGASKADTAPQKRYGHSATLIKDKMYVFGGLAGQKGGNIQTLFECQLKITNNEKLDNFYQWEKIKAEAPRARDSHTCVHIGNSLIFFAGSGGDKSFNDLYRYDLQTHRWVKLEASGTLPECREGHIAKAIGRDKMMIHGGVDQNEQSYNDTYILTGLFSSTTEKTRKQSFEQLSNLEMPSTSSDNFSNIAQRSTSSNTAVASGLP
jgi:N-acetylneuraminic acid mutarotase